MVSMDNCSHNGEKLYAAVNAFATAWTANGLVAAGFFGYVNDQKKVTDVYKSQVQDSPAK